MKIKFIQIISLLLAALLQMAPLLRSFVTNTQGLSPSAWGFILKVGVGTAALMGFDSVSKASSISISPPNATVGQFYSGTVSYSGGHAGTVSSMKYNSICLGSPTPFVDNLTIVYASGNKATVTGTPTSAANFPFSITVYSGSSCGGGHQDTRSTTLVVGSSSTNATTPAIVAAPQNTVAQVGTDVQLSGGASGYPIPQYQWWTGLGTSIPGATNSILTLTNVQISNAGIYTMTASNSSTIGGTFFTLPKANCYLSVCITAGTNFVALDFTNFAPASVPLSMYSFLTNGTSTTTNYYSWFYNLNNAVILSTSNTLPLTAATLTPAKGGTYSVSLNSTNSGGAIVSAQNYDSYWAFGYLPAFTNSLPAATNVNASSNVTFTVGIRGTLNVFTPGGGAAFTTNNGTPCVFWYKDGALVASQTNVLGPTSGTTFSNSAVTASFILNNVTPANAGNYTVVATNFWGSITSSPAALSVTSSSVAPGIPTNPPANLSLLAGQSSAISVTVTGTPPFFYQWRNGGSNLANGGVYDGVFTNILTLTSVLTNNSGNYTVMITNATGSITSSVAAVNVALPPQLSGAAGSPGYVQFSGNTITGLTYVVQLTTNLTSLNWSPVLTNNTGVTGAINFQTNNTSGPNKFYRLFFP